LSLETFGIRAGITVRLIIFVENQRSCAERLIVTLLPPRENGPVTVYAQKRRIVMQVRVRFAGAVVRKNWLDASMWLRRRITHPCLVRTESFGDLGYGHHFRLRVPEDVDASLVKLLGEAYQLGNKPRLTETLPELEPDYFLANETEVAIYHFSYFDSPID
jgi:hypothetical protein